MVISDMVLNKIKSRKGEDPVSMNMLSGWAERIIERAGDETINETTLEEITDKIHNDDAEKAFKDLDLSQEQLTAMRAIETALKGKKLKTLSDDVEEG